MSFSLFLSGISLGRYCRKSLAKSVGFRKNIKRGNSHVWALSIEGGFKPTHYDIERLKGEPQTPEFLGGPKLERSG